MAEESRSPGAAPGRTPPASVEEALQRARRHARAAVGESLAALHALLDAASLATSGRPSDAQRWLSPVARTLEGLSETLAGESDPRAEPLLAALADALDAEIGRWEKRAAEGDSEARAVLRTFLGVRELLWELGVRKPVEAGVPAKRARGRSTGRRRGPRVQRVPVEG